MLLFLVFVAFYLRGFGFCSERQFASIRNGGLRSEAFLLNGMEWHGGTAGTWERTLCSLAFLLFAFWGWVVY